MAHAAADSIRFILSQPLLQNDQGEKVLDDYVLASTKQDIQVPLSSLIL